MFRRVLIASRGATACRVVRTLRRMGIASIAVYSRDDRQSRHVLEADEALELVTPDGGSAYETLLAAARRSGAEAIYPDDGAPASFIAACDAARIAFIGPRAEHIEVFSSRHRAREFAQTHRVPVLPGSALLPDLTVAERVASRLGFPLLLKCAASAEAAGHRILESAADLPEALTALAQLDARHLGHRGVYLEKYVELARHIDVPVMGDGRGKVVAFGDRDGSVQRRQHGILVEARAPELDDAVRTRMVDSAVRLAEAARYRSAGTVQFLFDAITGQFHFIGLAPRLDFDHVVTEQVMDVDLVELMLRVAAAENRALEKLKGEARGVSLQVQVHAEDPGQRFRPTIGVLTDVRFPAGARVETWVERGSEITATSPRVLATVAVHGDTRHNAIARLSAALQSTRITGIETNLAWLRSIVAEPAFVTGLHTTRLAENLHWRPSVVHVLDSGVQTTIQDWPGRTGYWEVGVPPSGPMDDFAFRVANALVGNQRSRTTTTAGLECTMTGPTLRFDSDAVIAVTGAPTDLRLDGEPLEMWTSHAISAGSVLKVGRMPGPGWRAYLAVAGGFDVPAYLGSRATFLLGKFGGHAGRSLRAGDVLHLAQTSLSATLLRGAVPPVYRRRWTLGVLVGPQAAPDFLTPADLEQLLSASWTVHFNSSRTGLRLVGPKLQWARADGGEAGLHPASIHDNPVTVGALQFAGDTPVIIGPDGPSLGGGVCPAVVAQAELWKLGQIRPGDEVRFAALTPALASELARRLETSVERLEPPPDIETLLPSSLTPASAAPTIAPSPILGGRLGDPVQGAGTRVAVTWRQAGDACVLVEYGAEWLDLGLRLRVHALMEALRTSGPAGLLDLTPGVRSLQIRFDPARLPRARLLQALERLEESLPSPDEFEVPSRAVHLPLAWEDSSTLGAMAKYSESVRPEAPWLPSTIEFIRRVNGLPTADAVRERVFEASWLVLGLGDVYLGAPLATAIDPRHRLITPRQNPPRTWTAEGAVGLAGPYLGIHAIDGPGAHQLIGRTLPVWSRYRVTSDFEWNRPWLLRFFDRVRFFPVSEAELAALREDFATGRYRLRIEPGTFSLRRHREFLANEAASIHAFRMQQQSALEAERERWRTSGEAIEAVEERQHSTRGLRQLPEGSNTIATPVAGRVWRILKRPGDLVSASEAVLVVESMQAEFPVLAASSGRVLGLLCREGTLVTSGQDVVVIEALRPDP